MLSAEERQAVGSLAHFLLQHERLDDAETLLRGLCHAVPEDPYGWYGLAIVAERRGDLEAAAELHERSCKRSTDPRYHLSLGECMLRLGRPSEAEGPLWKAAAAADEEIVRRAQALLRRFG